MPTPARVVVAPPEAHGKLRIEDVVLPDPSPNQVVIKQFASGICHSQLHWMNRDKPSPMLLGHESTGVVTEVGSDVTHVSVGDTVLCTWIPRNPSLTPRPAEPAVLTLGDGTTVSSTVAYTWSTSLVVDSQYVIKVAGDINKEASAIIACAVITGAGAVIGTADVKKGQSVAIFGVGGVGLSAIAAAAVAGADPIIAVDLDPQKLEFARKFGATVVVDASKVDAVTEIRRLTTSTTEFNTMGAPTAGVDWAFDCIGLPKTIQQAVGSARNGIIGRRRGGNAVLVGLPQTRVELDALDMIYTERSLISSLGGSCSPEDAFPLFLQWHADGKLDLDALVSKRYALDEIQEACDALEAGKIAGRAIVVF